MVATPENLPGLSGSRRPRRGRGGFRALVILFSLCVSVVVIDAFAGDRGLAALMRTRQDHDRLAAEVGARKRENDRLREQIQRLRDGDPAAIEEIARRELGLIKPGERLFIIRNVTPASQRK
ncbi:MAG: septum formation initiator family protein [Vicinamibacterales bacterium]|jgi:cell division protein FtsB|nr:septum formation initiator family protein [Vicinamibacterales bacterium]